MIDTPDALNALVTRAQQMQAVALDTEFVWEQTFYPRLGRTAAPARGRAGGAARRRGSVTGIRCAP